MTRRQLALGPRGPLTGQTLAWLCGRRDRLRLRQDWAAEEGDKEAAKAIRNGLKVVGHDIDVLENGGKNGAKLRD